jgi:hypothetical protein
MFTNVNFLVCQISKQLSFIHGHGPHKDCVTLWLVIKSDYWIEFPSNACVSTVRMHSKITELLQKFGRKKLFIYIFKGFVTVSTKSLASKIKSPIEFLLSKFSDLNLYAFVNLFLPTNRIDFGFINIITLLSALSTLF